MITALVQFNLPSALTLTEATRRFETSAPKYRNLPGLIRKYYICSEDGRTVGGVYLWESRADVERLFDDEWRARGEGIYGGQTNFTWVAAPVNVGKLGGNRTPKEANRTQLNLQGLQAAPGSATAVNMASAPRTQQPRLKGPLVWLDMDQQELDDAYDQVVYAPNRDQVGKRRAANSETARAVIGAPERVSYGQGDIE